MLTLTKKPSQSSEAEKAQIAKQLAANKARATALLQATLKQLSERTPAASEVKRKIWI